MGNYTFLYVISYKWGKIKNTDLVFNNLVEICGASEETS